MIFSKDFDLFSAIQKVRLSEKTSEILGQVSEKMKLESLAGLIWRLCNVQYAQNFEYLGFQQSHRCQQCRQCWYEQAQAFAIYSLLYQMTTYDRWMIYLTAISCSDFRSLLNEHLSIFFVAVFVFALFCYSFYYIITLFLKF